MAVSPSIELRNPTHIFLHPLMSVASPALFGLGAAGIELHKIGGGPAAAPWKEQDANPIAIAEALDSATHKAWRDWEPETLIQYCGFQRGDVQLLDKVMAVQVACTNADAFTNWHLFHHCCTAFAHRRASFQFLDAVSVLEAAWACIVLRQLGRTDFGPEVLRYLAVLCLEDGLLFFPWVGGEGLLIPSCKMLKGLVDEAHTEIAEKTKRAWVAGTLQELAPSAVDDSDPFSAQCSKIVNAQAYIRSQRPRIPTV